MKGAPFLLRQHVADLVDAPKFQRSWHRTGRPTALDRPDQCTHRLSCSVIYADVAELVDAPKFQRSWHRTDPNLPR